MAYHGVCPQDPGREIIAEVHPHGRLGDIAFDCECGKVHVYSYSHTEEA